MSDTLDTAKRLFERTTGIIDRRTSLDIADSANAAQAAALIAIAERLERIARVLEAVKSTKDTISVTAWNFDANKEWY